MNGEAVACAVCWEPRVLDSGVLVMIVVAVVARGGVVAGAAWVVIVVVVGAVRGGVVASAAWVVIVVVVVVGVRGGVAGAAWMVIWCASGEVRPWTAGPVVNTCPAAHALP
jgi:hypothetical protein